MGGVRAVSRFGVLCFVFLSPVFALGQEVTNGQGKTPKKNGNYSRFIVDSTTGRLALVANGNSGRRTYFHLDAFNGMESTLYKLVNNPDVLEFVVNHGSQAPFEKRSFIGVEMIRLYKRRDVSDKVNLYRNESWTGSNKQTLKAEDFVGPSMDLFVEKHESDQLTLFNGKEWHARPSGKAVSSWASRQAILEGLAVSSIRDKFLHAQNAAKGLKAQGTYRLLGFSEATRPDPKKALRFTVKHHGCCFLLINVFGPLHNRIHSNYSNRYLLDLGC